MYYKLKLLIRTAKSQKIERLCKSIKSNNLFVIIYPRNISDK